MLVVTAADDPSEEEGETDESSDPCPPNAYACVFITADGKFCSMNN